MQRVNGEPYGAPCGEHYYLCLERPQSVVHDGAKSYSNAYSDECIRSDSN